MLPPLGGAVEKGGPLGEVESMKTSSEVYSPCSGSVIAVNDELTREPGRINTDPYGSWFVRIRPSRPEELDDLQDAAAYTEDL